MFLLVLAALFLLLIANCIVVKCTRFTGLGNLLDFILRGFFSRLWNCITCNCCKGSCVTYEDNSRVSVELEPLNPAAAAAAGDNRQDQQHFRRDSSDTWESGESFDPDLNVYYEFAKTFPSRNNTHTS